MLLVIARNVRACPIKMVLWRNFMHFCVSIIYLSSLLFYQPLHNSFLLLSFSLNTPMTNSLLGHVIDLLSNGTRKNKASLFQTIVAIVVDFVGLFVVFYWLALIIFYVITDSFLILSLKTYGQGEFFTENEY